MARTSSLNEFLTDVAESIRTKKGTTDLISPSNFDTEISSIETGGVSGEVEVQSNGNAANYAWTYAVTELPKIIVKNQSARALNSFFQQYKGETLNLDFSQLNQTTNNLTSMFSNCINLKNINGLNTLDTSYVTTLENMFASCQALETIDLSTFNVSLINNIKGIFYGCSSLKTLDLSSWNITGANSTYQMFYNCRSLEDLDISGLDMSRMTQINVMFYNCINLTNLKFGYNLGASYSTTRDENYSYYKLDLSSSTKLTEESLISVLNGLADIATLGIQPQQCVLGETNLAKLTSEAGQQALAQAQAYGWTVS